MTSKSLSALLALVWICVSSLAQTRGNSTLKVANAELSWTMSKHEALDELKKQENNLVVPESEDESLWMVIDKQAKRTSARLRFDQKGRLLSIERNWTPSSDSSHEFAKAIYNLVSQHEFGECEVTTIHDVNPQTQIESVYLLCKKGGLKITHTEIQSGQTKIPILFLWEIIERPE